MLINDLYTNKTPAVAENALNEFAPSDGGGDSGNYFQALASAWYNGTFDSGSLEKGIKSQEDVERLLQRGIVCPDGVTRKFDIGYNSDFDGVVISSDDYYEHADHDETDSRTGKPFGPYDYMEFGDDDLDESAQWRDPRYKGQLYTQEKPDYNDTREYDRARWDPKPKGYQGRKEPIAGGEFPRTDPLKKGQGIGRSGIEHNINLSGKRKGLPSRDQITSLKGSIKDAHGRHTRANLPEGMEGQVVFSGTGADGGKYEIIQSGATDFMIHANGRHIDTYSSLQRAMSVLKNEVQGLQQGMAEGLKDLDKSNSNNSIQARQKKADDAAKRFMDEPKYDNSNQDRQKKADDAAKRFMQGVAEAQTDYQKRRQRERDVDAGKPVKPEPRNPQNDYFARRKKEKEQGVDESWKSALGGAALAGSMALGGAAAQAQNAPSGEDFLPAIVAHVTFKVNGNTVTKDINLGTSFKSPGQASAALEKFLKSKGIKFYEFNLERVSDTEYNNNYLDKTPLSDKGNPAAYHTADKGYTPSDNTAGDYMVKEVSPGDYRKKAAVSQAVAQTNQFFDRDDPAKVAAADQTIAKRTKGLARADARVRPYTPPPQDAEKQQRDLTARYPNIDELVADAERNRDPYYDRAEGSAYYAGREAEQNYQKLKQIQRVIQGLNESLQKKNLLEFEPVTPFGDEIRSRNSAMINPATQKPYLPSELAGYQSRRAARKAAVATPDPVAEPVAEPTGVAMPMNPYQVPTARTTPNPTKPVTAANTAMTTTGVPGFNAGNIGRSYTAPAAASKLQTIDAPAQLTGPAPVKQLGMADPNVTDVVAKTPTAKKAPVADLAALPAPAAPVTPNYSKGVADYSNTAMNAPAASVPNTKSMRPANMMPKTATAPPKPAVSTLTPTAKKEIYQYLTKTMKFGSKEANDAIKNLPPDISIKDAVKQIFRNSLGKPVTSESLTWSRNFDPGRSLYRQIKQDL